MFWIVKTRFSVGIWLHDPANDHRDYIKKALHIKIGEYESALKMLEEETKINLDMEAFRPNRLYKIEDDKIFVVFYNRRRVGFSEMDDADNFMRKNKMGWRYYRKKWRLSYQQAVSMVVSLGAVTGQNEIFGRKNPVCGRLYWRYLG